MDFLLPEIARGSVDHSEDHTYFYHHFVLFER